MFVCSHDFGCVLREAVVCVRVKDLCDVHHSECVGAVFQDSIEFCCILGWVPNKIRWFEIGGRLRQCVFEVSLLCFLRFMTLDIDHVCDPSRVGRTCVC